MNLYWNESRLLALISDQIEESDQIEYKAADAFKKAQLQRDEICKDVSAFANSAGGIIIYGIKEFNDGQRKHLPERIDPIDRQQFTREWVDQVINRIEPRIPNVKITPVPLSSGEHHIAYVIEIPKGQTAHQSPNGRYYRRYNFESLCMKDHEIRDVMGRKLHPSIETEISIWLDRNRAEAGVFWKVRNVGNVIAKHVMTVMKCPHKIKDYFLQENKEDKFRSMIDENVVYWELIGSNRNGLPLFPMSELSRVFKFSLSPSVRWSIPVEHLKTLQFKTYADEMPFTSGELNPDEITRVITHS